MQLQTGQLHGVIDGHVLQQAAGDAVGHALEPRKAAPMGHHVGGAGVPPGEGGRTPDVLGIRVPDIERLA